MNPLIILWVLLSVPAVYRFAYLMTEDTGPFRIFERLRDAVADRYGSASWQFQGATCMFCQTVWYSALASIGALILFPEIRPIWYAGVLWGLLLWQAIAGMALVLHWLVLTWIRKVQE